MESNSLKYRLTIEWHQLENSWLAISWRKIRGIKGITIKDITIRGIKGITIKDITIRVQVRMAAVQMWTKRGCTKIPMRGGGRGGF